jgi:hypothetical protein
LHGWGEDQLKAAQDPGAFAAIARDFGFAIDGDDVGISSEELLD